MNIKTKGWNKILKEEFQKEYYKTMWAFLEDAYVNETIYPPKEEVFSAFDITDHEDVKVLILGQDPYHGEGQAHGLSFSVKKGMKLPPSLKNIYKELSADIGVDMPDHGFLETWAKQGVMMLNAFLTVKESSPSSIVRLGGDNLQTELLKFLMKEKSLSYLSYGVILPLVKKS